MERTPREKGALTVYNFKISDSTLANIKFSDVFTLFMAVISSVGPAIKLVPVSAMASHPPLQNVAEPIFTESMRNCQ